MKPARPVHRCGRVVVLPAWVAERGGLSVVYEVCCEDRGCDDFGTLPAGPFRDLGRAKRHADRHQHRRLPGHASRRWRGRPWSHGRRPR